MSDFRREALGEGDRPPELSPELAFLAERQAAASVLLQRDRELYPTLLERYRAEGTSEELSEIALEAAGDIGAVSQSLRSRPDLLDVLEDSQFPGPPMILLDQLMFSYLLLTDAATEEQRYALLSPDALDELLKLPRVVEWLQLMGF